MKREGLLIFAFAFILLSITGISAGSLGIFEQDSTISLHQTCDNCTFVNLTSVKLPNGTILNIDALMTKINFDYNYSFSSTDLDGDYKYNTCGNPDGIIVCENIDFIVNKLGEEFTTGKALTYILLTIFVFVLFVFVLWLNIIIPFHNVKNSKGNVIMITKSKYWKIALINVTFGLFNWFLNLLVNISDKLISGFSAYYNMLSFVSEVSIKMAWPVFIVTLVWFFYNWIVDTNLNKIIKQWGEAFE